MQEALNRVSKDKTNSESFRKVSLSLFFLYCYLKGLTNRIVQGKLLGAQQDLWRRTESSQRSGGGMNPMELSEYHLSLDENGLTVSTTKDQTNLDFNFSESIGWWTTGKKLSIAEMIWLHNLIQSSGIQGVLQSLWRNTEPYQRGFNETRAA